MLVARFLVIVALFTLFGCSSAQLDDIDISTDQYEMNKNPPPPVECNNYQMACGGRCVDYTIDMNNCGFCDVKCNVRYGEFCYHGNCIIYQPIPDKWRPYDIRKDLGRPVY